MRRSNLTIGVYMLSVFLSGVAVGGFAHRLYTAQSVAAIGQPDRRPTPEEFRRKYVEELRTKLQLDSDQLARVHLVLDETRERFRAVKEKYKPDFDSVNGRFRPEMRAVHEAQVTQIRALLKSDTQRQAYDQFLAE